MCERDALDPVLLAYCDGLSVFDQGIPHQPALQISHETGLRIIKLDPSIQSAHAQSKCSQVEEHMLQIMKLQIYDMVLLNCI